MNALRVFINNFIELLNTTLLTPEELSTAIAHDKRPDLSIFLLICIMSFGNIVAVYQLRANYDIGFLFFLPVAFILSVVFFIIISILTGCVIDAFIKYSHKDKHISPWLTIRLAAMGLMPFLFLLPVSIPSSYFSFQYLFIIFFILLLFIWSLYIVITSIRYLYELEKRQVTLIVISSIAIVAGFPFMFMIWGAMEIGIIAVGG